MSNSLDPDQAQCFVGPDLDQKLFAKVISRQQKLPLAGKKLIGCSVYLSLTLCTLDKIFSRRHLEIFFSYFFMQTISIGDSLHEMSNPVFWEKIRKISPICRLLN